jgi:hypothetical protein
MRLLGSRTELISCGIVIGVEVELDFVLIEHVEDASVIPSRCGHFTQAVGCYLSQSWRLTLRKLQALWQVFRHLDLTFYHRLRNLVAQLAPACE